jgi:hypothetical protein
VIIAFRDIVPYRAMLLYTYVFDIVPYRYVDMNEIVTRCEANDEGMKRKARI